MSRLPSTPPRVTTSLRPSGENDGAPLMPGFDDTRKRLPVRSVCTKIDDLLSSNETYASWRLSGDQAGDMIGSVLSMTVCSLNPSWSDTIREYKRPSPCCFAVT